MQLSDRILTKAENLFFKYGVKSISMDDLARQLGISKKTLYQSVENKKDLIMQVFQNHAQKEIEAVAQIRTDTVDAIDEMIGVALYVIPTLRKISPTFIYDIKKYYHDAWNLMEQYNSAEVYRMIKDNIERGKKEEVYRAEINTDIIAKLYVAKCLIIVDEELFPLPDYNKEILLKEHMKYHIRGIATTKGLRMLDKHFKKLT
ncbi:MAG: TetR/AcrR family transcriptional regulator [Bacteroidota bacterium]